MKVLASEQEVSQAVDALRGSGALSLDLEGAKLGSRGGEINLVSLAALPAAAAEDVVAIDMATGAHLQPGAPLTQLLEDSSITKVMFDCRLDASALLHRHHCHLRGVFDLQLLDTLLRDLALSEDEQLSRLSPFLYRRTVQGQPRTYRLVRKLAGLAECCREADTELHPLTPELKQHVLDKGSTDHSAWMARPLPDKLLRPAAMDVQATGYLYQARMDDVARFRSGVEGASERYTAVHASQPPSASSPYQLHPLLPLGILNSVTPGITSPGSYQCTCCERSLNAAAFSKKGLLGPDRACMVCQAIRAQQHQEREWQHQQDDFEGYYSSSEYD